jgi:hypothetical protein
MSNLHVTSGQIVSNGDSWEYLLHEQADLELLNALCLVPLAQLDNFVELRFFSAHAPEAYIRKMPFTFSDAASIILAYKGKGWTRTLIESKVTFTLTGKNSCRRFAFKLYAERQFDSDSLRASAYFCSAPADISAQQFEEFIGFYDAPGVSAAATYTFGYTDYRKLYGIEPSGIIVDDPIVANLKPLLTITHE